MKKLLNWEETWKLTEAVNGLVTEAEMKLVFETIRAEGDKVKLAVELGCLFGRSTTAILNALDLSTKLYTVDNFAVQGSDTRDYFVENLVKKNVGKLSLLDMPAHEAAVSYGHHWKDGIDFIFIDADHQDHSIKEDCEDWLSKLNPGGVVAFHDYYNDQFPSVATRVEEFTQVWHVIGKADSLMIKRRPYAV